MPIESQENKQKRVKKILSLMPKMYPNAHCALHHSNAYELLIATILSAQCTDERVNGVTKTLFANYPTLASYAEAPLSKLEEAVRTTGFFRSKAKNIQTTARILIEKYDSKVPRSLEALTELAGVGRKTANVVLGNAFGIASGVVVDTHVRRLSNRLGLTKSQNPEIIERDLMKLIPEKDWVMWPHWLITHGRQICKARSPKCDLCRLSAYCPSTNA